MTIKPLGNNIQLKIEEAKAGALITSSRDSAVEYAEVISVPEECNYVKVGDKVFVKAWAVDIIQHNDQKYYFCNVETNGILAVVNE